MEWGRSLSYCFFCFYQQNIEWVLLKVRYLNLYKEIIVYKRLLENSVITLIWSWRESLPDLERPEKMQEIKEEKLRRQAVKEASGTGLTLTEVYHRFLEAKTEPDIDAYLICKV